MSDIEALDKMLDNLINDKGEQAQVNFHAYLQDKMQTVIHGEEPVSEITDDTTNNSEE